MTTSGGSSLRDAILRELLQACGDRVERGSMSRISDQELVALVARLFHQFLSVESAAVAISTEVMQEGQTVRLPGYVANLRGYTLQLLRTGGSDSVETINDYLGRINRWFAACLSAWARAPNEWWQAQWPTIDPASIESKKEQGRGLGRLLRNRYQQFWEDYSQRARDLNPPDVRRKISNKARELARQEMEDDMKEVAKRSASGQRAANASQDNQP